MSLRIEGTLEPTIIRRLKENISDRDNIMLHMGELAIIMILASVYIHKTLIPDHGWTVSLAKHVGYNHIMLQHQPKYPKYCMDCMWHMVCPVQMLNSQLLSARSDQIGCIPVRRASKAPQRGPKVGNKGSPGVNKPQ